MPSHYPPGAKKPKGFLRVGTPHKCGMGPRPPLGKIGIHPWKCTRELENPQLRRGPTHALRKGVTKHLEKGTKPEVAFAKASQVGIPEIPSKTLPKGKTVETTVTNPFGTWKGNFPQETKDWHRPDTRILLRTKTRFSEFGKCEKLRTFT